MTNLILILNKKLKSIFLKKSLFTSKHRAVTPIIATILILALVVSGVVIGFVQIIPYIEQSQVETGSASVQSSLIKIDNVFWDMIGDSAGNYFPDSLPSRKLQVTLPIGSLENIPNENNISYEPMHCPLSVCPASFTAGVVNNSYGALKHKFSSTYVLIPADTIEYLTGADPFQRRDMVAYSSLTSSTSEDQSATNLTLSRDNIDHYVELSYRPKIFVTQSIENGVPTYNVGIFFIKLTVASAFIGTTNVFIKLTKTTINENILNGTSGDSFQVLFQIGNTINAYAELSASLGGFTTQYIVKATTYHFSISG